VSHISPEEQLVLVSQAVLVMQKPELPSQLWPAAHWTSPPHATPSMQLPVAMSQRVPPPQSASLAQGAPAVQRPLAVSHLAPVGHSRSLAHDCALQLPLVQIASAPQSMSDWHSGEKSFWQPPSHMVTHIPASQVCSLPQSASLWHGGGGWQMLVPGSQNPPGQSASLAQAGTQELLPVSHAWPAPQSEDAAQGVAATTFAPQPMKETAKIRAEAKEKQRGMAWAPEG
jgi:hypothetical protein